MFYAYYIKDGDEFILKTIENDKVSIKYLTDNTAPRVEEHCYVPTTYFGKHFTIPSSTKTIFVIPKGSIKNDFNLDAQ